MNIHAYTFMDVITPRPGLIQAKGQAQAPVVTDPPFLAHMGGNADARTVVILAKTKIRGGYAYGTAHIRVSRLEPETWTRSGDLLQLQGLARATLHVG